MSTLPTLPRTLKEREDLGVKRARQALRLVCAELPHLAGLAHMVRVKADRAYNVAAISTSGLLLINPEVFCTATLADAAFVMAHELMHLALDTHGRVGEVAPHLANMAHDYIINDILSYELNRRIPLGGLEREGARGESFEALVVELSSRSDDNKEICWRAAAVEPKKRPSKPGKSAMSAALEKAGLIPPEELEPEPGPEIAPAATEAGDLIPADHEQKIEPEISVEKRTAVREQVRRAAVKALSLEVLRREMDKGVHGIGSTDDSYGESLMSAVHTAYQPPWQLALQRWLDAVAPAGRTYAKASRRGAERDDGVVLCGRSREGWALHIVLDTSGSMVSTLPRVLGVIASFCESAGVAAVHILQCDTSVTADEWLEPAELAQYKIAGFGGSDMSPGMDRLCEDSEVHAVLVLTDGYISYPASEPPYRVLWGIFDSRIFSPPYGEVVYADA